MQNEFANLDAQDITCSFAQFTTEEHAEYQQYLDEQALREELAAQPSEAQ